MKDLQHKAEELAHIAKKMTDSDNDDRVSALESIQCEARLIRLERVAKELMIEQSTLIQRLEDILDEQHNKIKIPHRCPICNGKTCDEQGDLCDPCDGRGIVWG